uniref:Reticulon-like protein n=1 Tax=Trichobilharzia regenti TaxID=157069 RepID=A0AA85JYA8_TRIRE|nr:unnamed protein product [Trichobilharzia regenti]
MSGQMACSKNCPMAEKVRSIIYWRKPIVTGAVLAVLLTVEFSFMCLSAISFVAYIGLALLVSVNLMRLYYQFIAKTEQNFIREYLEREITVPEEKAVNVARRLSEVVNKGIVRTREIFLLTDPGASIKFAVLLYLLTYIGAQFNFLTLCVLFTIGIFCVPKFYERYQPEIDKMMELAKSKLAVVSSQEE